MRQRAVAIIAHVGRLIRRSVRQELGILLALLLVFGGIWLFIEVADEVVAGERQRLDEAVIRMLREPGQPGDPIGPAALEQVMIDLTALGGYTLLTLFTLAVLGFLLLRRYFGSAVLLTAAVVGGAILSQGFKLLFDRPRPTLVPHLTEVVSPSFPSGHATLSAVVYLTLGALLAELFVQHRMKLYCLTLAIIITALVGVTRVYLGVHWPSDVLAGWAIGLAWAALVWAAARLLRRYRHWRQRRMKGVEAASSRELKRD